MTLTAAAGSAAFSALMRQAAAAPLYAILDAARDPEVLAMLQRGGAPYRSLYEGRWAVELAQAAPYIVAFAGHDTFLGALLNAGWGRSWGCFLNSGLTLDQLREHLRQLLVTEIDGHHQLFRFYDPRVLRVYLPTCAPPEYNHLFGAIQSFMVESADASELLRFTRAFDGLITERIRVC